MTGEGEARDRLVSRVRTQKHDTELGSLRLNVEEIARNKTMKDVWPLQQANKGDIELTLTFQPVIFEEDEAVRTSSSRCCLAITDTAFDCSRGCGRLHASQRGPILVKTSRHEPVLEAWLLRKGCHALRPSIKRDVLAQDDVLSDSSAPSMQPSAGSLAQQSAQGQLPGEAPRSGSYAPEAHSQKELGNAVGTAIGKPRVGSRTMMSPQQAAADEQKTQQVRVMPQEIPDRDCRRSLGSSLLL